MPTGSPAHGRDEADRRALRPDLGNRRAAGTVAVVILAELEVCHSRPIAPTRRIALGAHDLPVDPPPGFGGILLAGIVATFACALDEDLFGELGTLLRQVERGQRIRQPRLRHRFQQDRVGLMRVRHRLHGEGEVLRFDVDAGSASPAQHILAAVYASAQLRPVLRQPIIDGLRIGMQWKGPVGPALVARVSGRAGTASWSAAALSDPLGWARVTLGFALDDKITRSSIQRRFREQLRAVHPDHGAEAKGAAQRITDISEARRILLA